MVCAEGVRRGWGSMCAEDPVKPQWKRGCVRRPRQWSGERWWRLGQEGSRGPGVQAESRRLLGVRSRVGAAVRLSRVCSRLRFFCVSPPEAWMLQPVETVHFSQERLGRKSRDPFRLFSSGKKCQQWTVWITGPECTIVR